MKRLFLTICLILISAPSWALNRYVTPTGTATWAASQVEGTPCSLTMANTYADDDDVVILADGDYGTTLYPKKSGSAGHPVTFRAATKYGAIIKNPTPWTTNRQAGIILNYNYLVIDGIKVDATTFTATGECQTLWNTWSGVHHLEVKNCWFIGKAKNQFLYATNVWLHDNLFDWNGATYLCDDFGGGLQIGTASANQYGFPGYVTIENNVFRYGGHHNLETYTWKNVVRNNFFHNEGNLEDPGGCPYGPDTNDKHGNRNYQIYDYGDSDGTFVLVEGNRFGPAGPSPDDDGGDGLTITAPKNIIRHNEIYSAQNSGVLFKLGYNSYSNDNRFYNNTITGSGRFNNTGGTWQGLNVRWYRSTALCAVDNVIKNNIFYLNGGSLTIDMNTDGQCSPATYTSNTVTDNFCTYDQEGKCSVYGDPLFADGTLPSIDTTPVTTDPDLTLQAESPAIDAGTYLTQATGAGTDSTALTVDDALYFQDGTWGSSLSDVQADWIAIGTVTNVVQIESIDYTTNVITLTVPMTWDDSASIWLYRDSDGTRVLSGAAPDQGAHESNAPDTVVSGTLVGDLGLTEDEIVTGGQSFDLTLSGTTWVADVVSDAAKKAALIAGITGNSADAHGWNNEVTITDVTRISDTVVRVVVPASSGYDIESPEVVSAQIAAALTASNEVINATPNITIDITTPAPPSGSAKAGVSRGTSSASGAAKGTTAAKTIQ